VSVRGLLIVPRRHAPQFVRPFPGCLSWQFSEGSLAKNNPADALLTKKGDCRLPPDSLGCYLGAHVMHADVTNKPLRAVQASTVPGAQLVCSPQAFEPGVDGLVARISFSGILFSVLGEQLKSTSGVPPVRSRQLRANSPHPTQLGRHCSSAPAMNLPTSFPACATSGVHAEKDAGSNYDQAAQRMNRAAVLPIISLTIRVLHPIHTDTHED
jgi:hypothetical protein